MSVLISTIKSTTIDWEFLFITNASIVGVAVVLLSILIPLIYKFGVEKSRFMMMAIILVPMIIAILLSNLGLKFPTDLQLSLPIVYGIIVFAVIIITIISFLTSLKLFVSKDF